MSRRLCVDADAANAPPLSVEYPFDRCGDVDAGQIGMPAILGAAEIQSAPFFAVLSIDERAALCLLAMARDLLRRDHGAVAAMIDYAMRDLVPDDDDCSAN